MTQAVPAAEAAPRPGRLRRSADVQHVLRQGRRHGGDLLAVHAIAPAADPGASSDGIGQARLTVVASRKVGNAVRRNRAKRLLREAARSRRWRPGLDVVLVARAACADSDVHRVGVELERLAAKVDAIEVRA